MGWLARHLGSFFFLLFCPFHNLCNEHVLHLYGGKVCFVFCNRVRIKSALLANHFSLLTLLLHFSLN